MKATVRVQTDRQVARASDYLRGHFIEHVHRCLTGGICDEGSPHSDARGFRLDVLEHLRALRPAAVRYPGGNFACDYDWRQGILPKEQRPTRFNHGTRTVESYRFGTHEFIEYCRELGAEPMLTINVGTGTPWLAADWVAYCNAEGDNDWARLRRANGFDRPWGIKHWFIGNEIYGDWVPGTKSGRQYAEFAADAIRRMKAIDPTIQPIGMATGTWRPDWDRDALDGTVDLVDYVSLHIYVGRHDYYNCVGSPAVVEKGIRVLQGAIESAACLKNARRLPKISLDEYNIWYRTRHFPDRLEETYNLQDALALAGIQHVLYRNADVVGMACISEAVNALGIMHAEPSGSYRQTLWWVLKMVADHFASEVVDAFVNCLTFSCRHPKYFAGVAEVDAEGRDVDTQAQKAIIEEFTGLPYLDVCAMVDRERRRLVLSAINRHESEGIEATVEILGHKVGSALRGHLLTAPSVKATNTMETPNAVTAVQLPEQAASNQFSWQFPPHSYEVLVIDLA